MKIQKKLSATITLTITAIFVVSMIASAYSVTDIYRRGNTISSSIVLFAEPATIGVGQPMTLQALLYPPSGLTANITMRLTAPNGTNLYYDSAAQVWTNTANTNTTLTGTATFPQLEMAIKFVPDAVGKWLLWGNFSGITNAAGDVYTATSDYNRRPIFVQAAPITMPATDIVTRGFIDAEPGKIGTGQSVYLVGWVTPPRELQGGIFHTQFKTIITKPDGSKEEILKYPDSPATMSFNYICTQAGTYSAVLSFAGDVYPTFKFLPCTSPAFSWIVEDGFNPTVWQEEPLPTGQWKYPINAEFQQWYQISGPWAESGAQFDASKSHWNPNTKGPNSAHIIWAKGFEGSIGGIIGGETPVGGDTKAFTGSTPSFVAWQGRLWYLNSVRNQTTNTPPATSTNIPNSVTQSQLVCVDQFTGQELWRKLLPGPSANSLKLELQPRAKIDPRQEESQGVVTNLWAIGNGLRLVNPFTGECSYYNTTFTPSMYYNHRFYYIGTNSSTTGDGEAYCLVWDIEDRADIMKISLGREYRTGHWIDFTVDPIRLVRISVSYGMWPITTKVSSWRLDTGELLVNGTEIPNIYATEGAPDRAIVGWGILSYHDYSMGQFGIDTATGKLAWLSEPQEYPWGMFNAYNLARGYHLIYANSWDGYQYAYVAETGALVWKAYSADAPLGEEATGTYSWWGNTVVGDEKVYTATAQHTQPSPPTRGDALYALNALTGDRIWKLDNFQASGGQSLASGVLTYGNAYDGRVYAFATGPTATTVTAPLTAVPLNSPVLLQGTCMDMSPGMPNTPAVSDDSQNQWMQYLYQNKPIPMNATGVVVHLEALSADGTRMDITHVTTDLMGHYEYLWTPPAEGAYKVIATLDPTDSYYTSSGTTAVGVGPAAYTGAGAEQPPAADNTLQYGILVAVIIAIVIGLFAVYLVMKKK